jgi:hypothetical protein
MGWRDATFRPFVSTTAELLVKPGRSCSTSAMRSRRYSNPLFQNHAMLRKETRVWEAHRAQPSVDGHLVRISVKVGARIRRSQEGKRLQPAPWVWVELTQLRWTTQKCILKPVYELRIAEQTICNGIKQQRSTVPSAKG